MIFVLYIFLIKNILFLKKYISTYSLNKVKIVIHYYIYVQCSVSSGKSKTMMIISSLETVHYLKYFMINSNF